MSVTVELEATCRFAYEQLRRPDCPVTVPTEMLTFLHHSRLSARALSVAHRAIETDPVLRRHLAETATVARVGERGWAWLNQADGLSKQVIDLRTTLEERNQQLAQLQAEIASLRVELAQARQTR